MIMILQHREHPGGIDNDNDGRIDSEDDNEFGEPRSFAANVAINKIAEDNKKIKLDLTSFKERSNEFAIPMPSITSGKYNILWRALSPDGHIIKGKSEFEVK